MWTHTIDTELDKSSTKGIWTPNHFVYCLPKPKETLKVHFCKQLYN
jgi:hypothetical protein